jgi:hypothetical protein
MSSCIRNGQFELAKNEPALCPFSAHNPRFEFSSEADLAPKRNNQGTARQKGPVERDLQCLLRPSSEFAPRLGQHAERADGMEHSSAAFCVRHRFGQSEP